MKLSIIRTLALSSLTALTIVSVAHGEMIPINEARESRLGGIVTHSETNEELFLGCVEDNDAGTCIQYRFIAQLGDASRVLGNQPVEPFKISTGELVGPARLFEGRKALPALSWMGEGFVEAYSWRPDVVYYGSEGAPMNNANAIFASYLPLVGLPGVGSVVLAGSAAYDAGRLMILSPIEIVRTTMKNIRTTKLNQAFSTLFNPSKRLTSETHPLSPKRFSAFKAELTRLSTAPTDVGSTN